MSSFDNKITTVRERKRMKMIDHHKEWRDA
jgi:hypothetical protein